MLSYSRPTCLLGTHLPGHLPPYHGGGYEGAYHLQALHEAVQVQCVWWKGRHTNWAIPLSPTISKVLDYSQFSLSLSQSNKEARATWDLQYNFSSLYSAESISPASLDQVYTSMVNQRSTMLDNYLLANTAGVEQPSSCSESCRKVQLCAIPNVDITNFRKCISQANLAVMYVCDMTGVMVNIFIYFIFLSFNTV